MEELENLINKDGIESVIKKLELIVFNLYIDNRDGPQENLYYCLFLDLHNARAGYNSKKQIQKIGFTKV